MNHERSGLDEHAYSLELRAESRSLSDHCSLKTLRHLTILILEAPPFAKADCRWQILPWRYEFSVSQYAWLVRQNRCLPNALHQEARQSHSPEPFPRPFHFCLVRSAGQTAGRCHPITCTINKYFSKSHFRELPYARPIPASFSSDAEHRSAKPHTLAALATIPYAVILFLKLKRRSGVHVQFCIDLHRRNRALGRTDYLKVRYLDTYQEYQPRRQRLVLQLLPYFTLTLTLHAQSDQEYALAAPTY